MKELKLNFLIYFSDIMCFETKSNLYNNFEIVNFLENKNFKTTKFQIPIKRYRLDLKSVLNLKQFKIEIL